MRYAILAFTGMISAAPSLAGSLHAVTAESFCVTEGSITPLTKPYLKVSVPKMRAVLKKQTGQLIEARFKYMGPTDEIQPLGSGEIRYQFGFKLRANLGSSKLSISVDAAPEWTVAFDPDALPPEGPVGVRSDNVHLKLKVLVPAQGTSIGCHHAGGED